MRARRPVLHRLRPARGPPTTQGRRRSPCPRSSGPGTTPQCSAPTAGRSGRSRTGSRRTQRGPMRVAQRAEALQEAVRRDDDPAVALDRLDRRSRPTVRSPTPDPRSRSGPARARRRRPPPDRRAHAASDTGRGRAGSAPRHPGRPVVRNAALPFTPTTPLAAAEVAAGEGQDLAPAGHASARA